MAVDTPMQEQPHLARVKQQQPQGGGGDST